MAISGAHIFNGPAQQIALSKPGVKFAGSILKGDQHRLDELGREGERLIGHRRSNFAYRPSELEPLMYAGT